MTSTVAVGIEIFVIILVCGRFHGRGDILVIFLSTTAGNKVMIQSLLWTADSLFVVPRIESIIWTDRGKENGPTSNLENEEKI